MEEYKYITINASGVNAAFVRSFIDSIPRNFLHHLYSVECTEGDKLILQWYRWFPPPYGTGQIISIAGRTVELESSILSSLQIPSSLGKSLEFLLQYKDCKAKISPNDLPTNLLNHVQMLDSAGLVDADIHTEFEAFGNDTNGQPQIILRSIVRGYTITSEGRKYATEHGF